MAIAKHKTRRRELREGRALARRFQRGDRRAFELIYASYEGRLYRFCHRLTGSDAAAASLVEAAFVRTLATLPAGGRDGLDMPAQLASSARVLAYERHTNGGAPWLDPVRGDHASEVAAANQRLAPRQRMALALRDLEGRPDDEIALALGADAAQVAALVARARLRLRAELRLPGPPQGCGERAGDLSALADGTLPLARRAEIEEHVVECAGCRAALFALQEATLRYRDLPVPVPPGELRSRTTVALGAVGFPTRRPRALVPDPAPGTSGRPVAAAVAMAALIVLGAVVTVAASKNVWGAGAPTPAVKAAPPPPAAPTQLVSQRVSSPAAAGTTSAFRAPPVLRHVRTGPRRPAQPPPQRKRQPPPDAGTPDFASGPAFPQTTAPAPPPATSRVPPLEKPKLKRPIPVEILPPITPQPRPATADAPPPPPEHEPAGPAETTST